MTSTNSPSTDENTISSPDQHADKYNDPRVKITRRGVLMGVGVFVVASITAGLSIYARKTPLEKTREFWGQETITALQLAERIELFPRGNESFERVELTTTPGLGHLRRALLDERNFAWDTVDDQAVASTCVVNEAEREQLEAQAAADSAAGKRVKLDPRCIQLRLTDPNGKRVGTIEIDIDLASGWVGPADGSRRVRTTDYVQPKLKNYFATVINVKELTYDER